MKKILAPLAILVLAGCLPAKRDYAHSVVSDAYRKDLPHHLVTSKAVTRTVLIPTTPLDLETAVQAAMINNPGVRGAMVRVRRAEAMLAMSRAAFLPSLDARVGVVRADAPSTYLFKRIDQREFSNTTDFNDPGIITDVELGLDARLNLYNGGRDALTTWQAESGREAAEMDVQGARNALAAAVIAAWYDLAAAEEMQATAEASVKTVQAQHDDLEKKVQAGEGLKAELLTMKVRVAEAKEAAIRARTGKGLARAALANLLGGDADTEIVLDPNAECPCTIPEDYGTAVTQALQCRPELKAIRRRVEAAAMGVDAARAGWLPRVDAHAGGWFNDRRMAYNAHDVNWRFGANLSWNLFAGGRTVADTARSQAVLAEALEGDREMTLRVQLDVKRAYLALEEAKARVAVTEASVEAAEENLDIVTKQFTSGAATVTRYLGAETMLTRARMTRTQAGFSLKKAHADAARAVGAYTHADLRGSSRITPAQQKLKEAQP